MESANLNKTLCMDAEPGGGFLEADDARTLLFNKLLEQFAASSLFSNSSRAPSVFIVYAHDNVKQGFAYDGCVRNIISWLEKIHARILSDQSPLPPFQRRLEGDDAIRNILANQLCLLPQPNSDGALTITSVDKVIVCGSEVLEKYYSRPSALAYVRDVLQICTNKAHQSMEALHPILRAHVETQSSKDDFHHILTELAFLEVRKSILPEAHGMIPLDLSQVNTGKAPMRYLPIFDHSDVKLKLNSLQAGALHKLFFKLLEQLYPDHRDFIESFRQGYQSINSTLEPGNYSKVTRGQFNVILNRCISEAYRQYSSLSCTSLRDEYFQVPSSTMSYQVSRVFKMMDQDTKDKILDWISPVSTAELHGKYHDAGTSRLQGTCNWIIENEEFRTWYSHKGSSLVFLYGNMGTGKTYSTSKVIDWVMDRLSVEKHDQGFAYFYCNKQDSKRSEPKEILRNIIRQLATGPWKAAGSSKGVHKEVYNFWEAAQHLGKRSTFHEWEDLLLKIIGAYPRVTIVVDALDECEKKQLRDLINLFVALGSRNSEGSSVKIFMSMRSEEDALRYFDSQLGFPAIRTDGKHNAHDIEVFVRTKISEHHRWSKMPEIFRAQLIRTLLVKTGDMILFASLQIDHLLECKTQPALMNCLEKLPDSLEKTYEDIYRNATPDPDERKLLDRALQWVLSSLKPLTTDELVLAICQGSEFDEAMPQRQDVDKEVILDLCHNLLILDVSFKSHVWRFAHQAVAEFLLKKTNCNYEAGHYELGKVCLMVLDDVFGRKLSRIKTDRDQVPETIGDYVCPCGENERPHRALKHSLAEYAIYAWPTHLKEACRTQQTGQLSRSFEIFLGDPETGSIVYNRWLEHASQRQRWFKSVSQNRQRPSHAFKSVLKARYALVGHHYPWYPRWSIFATREVPPPLTGRPKMKPISLACYLGFYDMLPEGWVPSMLDQHKGLFTASWFFIMSTDFRICHTRDIFNVGSLTWEQPWKWSPVALACAHDQPKVVKSLLDRGAAADALEEGEVSPLVVAMWAEATESTKELLQFGEVCWRDDVLHFVFRMDSLDILKPMINRRFSSPRELEKFLTGFPCGYLKSADAIAMLLDMGVNANAPLRHGTLLAAAVYHGWEELVERLLDQGADVNTHFEGREFRNALEAAVQSYGTLPIASLLLKRGARITAKVIESVHRWHPSKYETLHQFFGPSPAVGNLNEIYRDKFGNETSALIAAIKLQRTDDIRFLIQHGADVNLKVGVKFQNALSAVFWAALEDESQERFPHTTCALLEVLVEEGARFEDLDGDHINTALAGAAYAGLDDTVQSLLARGADPDALCGHAWFTALGAAVASKRPEVPRIVRTLLDYSTGINASFPKSVNGNTSDTKYAIDIPFYFLLSSGPEEDGRLDIWLQSASLLLSNGGMWDINFAQWRKCLEMRLPEFCQRNSHSLDQMLEMLKSNRVSFFTTSPEAASAECWRIKRGEHPDCTDRAVARKIRRIIGWFRF